MKPARKPDADKPAQDINTDGLPIDMPDLDTLVDAAVEMDDSTIAAKLNVKEFIRTHRRHTRHTILDARKVETAIETIGTLPKPGETIHVIVGNAFAGFDLLPAFLSLTGASRFDELYLTTLGFSRDNLSTLQAMLQARQIRHDALKILCGDFFRRADSGLWDIGALLAKERRFTFRSFRNHTKIILARLAGRALVVESSANLRSCHNVEMFTLTDSAPLYRFHRGWIDEILSVAKP
jgi:hypothetical protein